MNNIEEFIIACEGLMITDYEIAIEGSIGENIKDRLKAMKEWFIKVCKDFWEKVKTLFNNIKDKISRNKKNATKTPTIKEEYNGLVKAHNILRSENGGKGDLIQMAEVLNEIKKDPEAAAYSLSAQNIVSEMKKNDTSLEEEKQKIVKEYTEVDKARDKADRTVHLIGAKLNSIDAILYDITEDLESEAEAVGRLIDFAINKTTTQIAYVNDIIKEYTQDFDDITTKYFKEQLKTAKYGFMTDRGKIVEYQLKSVKKIQERLSRLMDFATMSDDLNVLVGDSKTKMTPAAKIAGINKLMTCAISYQSLLITLLNF